MRTSCHLRIDTVALAPGQEWATAPPGWRFVQTSTGSAYWLRADQPRALSPGEVTIAPPGIEGLLRASQLNEVLLQTFYFDPDQLCGFFTLAERSFFDRCNGSASEGVQFFPSTHLLAREFAALVERVGKDSDLVIRVRLLALAVVFFTDRLSQHLPRVTSEMSAQHRFEKLVGEMPDLEFIRYTPDKLAQLCGCSPRHFNRLFHAQFSQSPRARQTELRLLKARQLLGSSAARVIEVAHETGYRSVSLFNSLFKRRFGLSPSEWRRQANNGNAAP